MRGMILSILLMIHGAAWAETLTIAAASDLKCALGEVAILFEKQHPGQIVHVVYGSSGRLFSQIQQGAPFDLFFSADRSFPESLITAGLAQGPVQVYGRGRLVLWSVSLEFSKRTIADLADPMVSHIAIANPKHAPYGQKAQEALRQSGVWDKVKDKLVFGENVAQACQFVQTKNAEVGIIAYSLVLGGELFGKGSYSLVPDSLYKPLDQGFVMTSRAKQNPVAAEFARFMVGPQARDVMAKFGFTPPLLNRVGEVRIQTRGLEPCS